MYGINKKKKKKKEEEMTMYTIYPLLTTGEFHPEDQIVVAITIDSLLSTVSILPIGKRHESEALAHPCFPIAGQEDAGDVAEATEEIVDIVVGDIFGQVSDTQRAVIVPSIDAATHRFACRGRSTALIAQMRRRVFTGPEVGGHVDFHLDGFQGIGDLVQGLQGILVRTF